MIDSMRSETTARAEMGRAQSAASAGVNVGGSHSRQNQARAAPTPAENTRPPAAPSQVFFGLMLGDILWRPTARPVRSAPMSQNFETAISQMVSVRPVRAWGASMIRMRTRNWSMNGT